MKARVLISGGAGFIGSNTSDALLEKGYRVRILDNLSSKTHNGKWPEYLDPRIEKIQGDVRSKSDWKKALKDVSFVIHLAAWMDLLPEPEKFFSINVQGTANLYEVIVKNKLQVKKIVVASSQFVYGQGKWKCQKHGIVFPKDRQDKDLQKAIWDPKCPECGGFMTSQSNSETHADPPNAYAISKYTQELIAIKLGRLYNTPSTALRYSIVHGPRQSVKNAYSGALRIFTSQMISTQNPSIFEDGLQLRDFVSVKDVALANILVMESDRANFEVFNVGGEKAYTITMLAREVAKQLKVKPDFSPTLQYRAGDIRHSYSDTTKIRKLGWKPQFSETENISEFISWFKTQAKSVNLLDANEKMKKLGVLKSAS